jgi:PAP2 superfamily
LPSPNPPAPTWTTRFATLVRRHFLLKTAGICLFMAVFFVLYFHTLREPVRAVFTMPLTALDRAVPFAPAALWPYASLWLYVGIPPGLMPSLHALLRYGIWAAAMCFTGLLFFHYLPTAVPSRLLPAEALQHPGFAVLQGVDAAGNACPSLHVAAAVFTAFWVAHLMCAIGAPAWTRVLNLAWVLAIVWSTLATRQHVALDAAAGALLGAGFAWAALRWGPTEIEPVSSRRP